MKVSIARALLWFAVIWTGIWFGGQLFNALMVVPYFSANPPESLRQWGQLRFSNLADFFAIFNTLWISLALAISLLLGWKRYGDARHWVLASMIAALLSFIVLMGWMVATISRLVSPDNGGLPLAEIQILLHRWTVANWIRLGIEFCGFVFVLRALSRSRTLVNSNQAS